MYFFDDFSNYKILLNYLGHVGTPILFLEILEIAKRCELRHPMDSLLKIVLQSLCSFAEERILSNWWNEGEFNRLLSRLSYFLSVPGCSSISKRFIVQVRSLASSQGTKQILSSSRNND